MSCCCCKLVTKTNLVFPKNLPVRRGFWDSAPKALFKLNYWRISLSLSLLSSTWNPFFILTSLSILIFFVHFFYFGWVFFNLFSFFYKATLGIKSASDFFGLMLYALQRIFCRIQRITASRECPIWSKTRIRFYAAPGYCAYSTFSF